jgi:hypothetical protein
MQVSDLCATVASHVKCGFGARMVEENCPIPEMSVQEWTKVLYPQSRNFGNSPGERAALQRSGKAILASSWPPEKNSKLSLISCPNHVFNQ